MGKTQQLEINGVDVEALKETIGQIKRDGSLGRFEFRLHNRWETAGHNTSTFTDFYGAGQDRRHDQAFELRSDEPHVMGGNDQAPNPVEFVLHALAACVTTTLVFHAAARGIRIDSLETTIDGELDVRGFLGISPEVPRGYQRINVTLKIKSDASAQQLKELAEYSPVFNTLINPVDVALEVQKA